VIDGKVLMDQRRRARNY